MSKRQKPDHKQLLANLSKDVHEIVNNKPILHVALEQFLNNLVDEITLGIIFDQHRKYKTNAYNLEVDEHCEEVDPSNVLTQHNLKKVQDCMCPNCDRAVAAIRFAPHLEACMGIGRSSRSRNASKRVVSNSTDRENSNISGLPSDDDDDDPDWSSGDRRKKKKEKSRNKKNRGTLRQISDLDSIDSIVNVDILGNDDDLTNLRDILHLQDHSNSTSPADSASSSGSGKRIREKSKGKKGGKRDRGSSPPGGQSME